MSNPIVIVYHLIFTAYGWWLPNDPRGSTSRFVETDVIFDLGNLHHGRKRVQPASSEIREFYDRASTKLRFALLEFDMNARHMIAEAFADTIREFRYTCYACAIMRDHVHLLIRKHKHLAEQMIANFQDSSRLRLRSAGLRNEDHPVWGGPGWKVFLDHPDEVVRTVGYIDENPTKAREARQTYPFVTLYDGWPLHPGHNPNSPYARRLREHGRY